MEKIFDSVPLYRAIKDLTRQKTKSTAVFYMVLFIITIALCVKAVSPSFQLKFMHQFHLNARSFPEWISLQFFPSMYNYNNEIWYSYKPISDRVMYDNMPTDPRKVLHARYNHFPLRFITFTLKRRTHFAGPAVKYMNVRSQFNGVELISKYRLIKGQNSLKIELIEAKASK